MTQMITNNFHVYSETNLKVRQALTETAEIGDNIDHLAEFNGKDTLKYLCSHATKNNGIYIHSYSFFYDRFYQALFD